MTIKLCNTLGRQVEDFRPLHDKEVRMYHCGPTVYDNAHIGNLRSYTFADTLRRLFEWEGFKVKQVINITDVGHLVTDGDTGEDKMMKALKREGKEVSLTNMRDVALKYEEAFVRDLKKLNVLLPHHLPRASEHIAENIEIIRLLEEKSISYQTSDGIYFDTSKFSGYGKLGGLSKDTEARIEDNPEKRSARDFALWKFSKDLGFESPWGTGFPGWHIECSSMARKYLDQPFDIHTGGIDHIPVHHNNEIAQSECAFDKPFANYWMHNAFVNIQDERIAKSIGNTYTLSDLEEKGFSPLAYRYYLLSIHYRTSANFTWEALQSAETALARLRSYTSTKDVREGRVDTDKIALFKEKMNDDLNTPEALAVAWGAARDENLSEEDKKATLLEMDNVLGLNLGAEPSKTEIPKNVLKLLEKREVARKNKDFAKSDEIRNKIEELGFRIKDSESGPKIVSGS
jgi:cysteinyl-tRNA synthetase